MTLPPAQEEFLRAWVLSRRRPDLAAAAYEAFSRSGSALQALVAEGALNQADVRAIDEQAARLRRSRQLVVFVELAARAGVDRDRLTAVGRALGGAADADNLGVAAVGAGLLDLAAAQQLAYQARLAVDRSLAAQAAQAARGGRASPSDGAPTVPSGVFRLEVPAELRAEARSIVDDELSSADARVAPRFAIPPWVDTSGPLVGTTVGPYIVVGHVGQGGNAAVHLVYREAEPMRPLALKAVPVDASPTAVGRFKRESLAGALFQHENVIEVVDAGCVAGKHFIAMEFFDGRDLGKLLEEEQQLAPAEALTVVDKLLAGLSAAHDAGVIHRDVKPENVLVSGGGARVKLLDFGVSLVQRLGALQDRVFTTTGTGFVGTPRYLSPEQAAGHPLDPRSDLYAVGLVLYEALSGEYPYDADAPLAYVSAHIDAAPRPLAVAAPWLRHAPAELHALVGALLAKDPDERPSSAAAAREVVAAVKERVARF